MVSGQKIESKRPTLHIQHIQINIHIKFLFNFVKIKGNLPRYCIKLMNTILFPYTNVSTLFYTVGAGVHLKDYTRASTYLEYTREAASHWSFQIDVVKCHITLNYVQVCT